MSTRKLTRRDMKQDEVLTTVARIQTYLQENGRQLGIIAGSVVGVAILAVAVSSYLDGRERAADESLADAMRVYRAPVGDTAPATGGPSYATDDERLEESLLAFRDTADAYSGQNAGGFAAYYAGVVLNELGRTDEALEQLSAVASGHSSGPLGALARRALAGVQVEVGQLDAAEQTYRELTGSTSYPEDAALFGLASVVEQLGRIDEARGLYQQIVDDHPESSYVGEARRRAGQLG